MGRSILAGVGGVVVTWALLCLSAVAWLSWTPSGHFVRGPGAMDTDSAILQSEYDDPFKLLNNAKAGYQLSVIPAISVITGLFVGFVSKARAGWIAALAMTPLQFFLLYSDSFTFSAFVRALVYFLLAYFCASAVQSTKKRKNFPPGTVMTA